MNEELLLQEINDLKIKYEQLRIKFNAHRDDKEVHKEVN